MIQLLAEMKAIHCHHRFLAAHSITSIINTYSKIYRLIKRERLPPTISLPYPLSLTNPLYAHVPLCTIILSILLLIVNFPIWPGLSQVQSHSQRLLALSPCDQLQQEHQPVVHDGSREALLQRLGREYPGQCRDRSQDRSLEHPRRARRGGLGEWLVPWFEDGGKLWLLFGVGGEMIAE